eukprot:CAMPEP_0116564604 /NCGR_PEP_ID=MMETSP0397-20121206/13397_1 /TAXON_ID=216820 /ORGANISM="Cyclophora tenuis, Strain ECT3854" /LENGTH=183 /DNA_ID=CAMNT_0004091209 /DNA_START=1 /DNA_END=552 /DNA_ORIENTATION=-
MVRVLLLVGSGIFLEGDGKDTLAAREQLATEYVRKTVGVVQEQFPSDWAPKDVGTTIPTSLIPTYVIIKMVAKVFALFGWGKRKQRESVSALAELAASLLQVVNRMSCALDDSLLMMSSSSQDEAPSNNNLNPEILDPNVWGDVCERVRQGRSAMRERIKTVLEEISDELATFDNNNNNNNSK